MNNKLNYKDDLEETFIKEFEKENQSMDSVLSMLIRIDNSVLCIPIFDLIDNDEMWVN